MVHANPVLRLPVPTDTAPETPERLAVEQARLETGYQVHHPADRRHSESVLSWRGHLAVFVERNGVAELVSAMHAACITELAAYLLAVLPPERQRQALAERKREGACHAGVS